MKKLIIITITGIILVLYACKKEKNEAPVDPDNPVITITKPKNHDIYDNGDTISIVGTATDNESLHEATLLLTVDNLGDTLYYENISVPDTTIFNFNSSYVVNITDAASVTLFVTFSDHEGNETTEKIHSHVRP